MKRKKQFISPQVLSQVELCLEGDLLVINDSAQYRMTASSMEQDLEVFDFTPAAPGSQANEYSVDWDE